MNPDLGRSAARGAYITMLGQLVRIVVQFGGLVVLARLLSPHDYGLMAMMIAIMGIAEVFRDFGLTQAAVQASSLSRQQRDNLFWINSAIGLVLSVSIFLLAPLLGVFFSSPELVDVARWTSVVFLLNGVSTQYRASLNRSMRFGALALADILASAVGLLTAVAAALLAWGYWALVLQQIVFAVVALAVVSAASGWAPRWYARSAPMGGLFRYGFNLLGVQLVANVSRNADTVILGARVGSVPLGYYDRAFQILMLPLSQINAPATKVALPVLSRLNAEPARFDAFLLRGQSALVNAVACILGYTAAAAAPLISIVLGARWIPSAELLQLLCLGGVAQAASYACYWVFLARGLTRQNLYYALATRPVIVLLIFVGSYWGATGVAVAYSLGLLLSWPVAILWLRQATEVPASLMFLNGLRAMLCWGGCAAAAAAALLLVSSWSPLQQVALSASVYVVSAALLVALVPPFRSDVVGIRGIVRLIRAK